MLERGLGELVVSAYGSNHRHGVDVGRFENLVRIGRYFDRRVVAVGPRERMQVLVTQHLDASVILSVKIPHDVGAPISVSNHSDSNHGTPASNLRIFAKNANKLHTTSVYLANHRF